MCRKEALKELSVYLQRHKPAAVAIPHEHLRIGRERTRELAAGPELRPADIAAAIAWGFCRFVIPEFVDEQRWPALATQAGACEALEVFKAWPIDRE